MQVLFEKGRPKYSQNGALKSHILFSGNSRLYKVLLFVYNGYDILFPEKIWMFHIITQFFQIAIGCLDDIAIFIP